MDILAKFQSQVLSILRIVSAYAFILHGTSKAFAFPVDMTEYVGSWLSLMGLATVLEIVAGTLLLVGFKTRLVAFILSGQMAVAYFMSHFSIFPLEKGGEPAMLFSFIFLYIATAGGGAWAIDNLCNKKINGGTKE